MFNFLKRQFATKTGKYVAGIIVGSALDGIARKNLGVGVAEVPFVGEILDNVFGSQTSAMALGFSYLRDEKAKARWNRRKASKRS